MAARMSTRKIVGLSWRKLNKSPAEIDGSCENLTDEPLPAEPETENKTKDEKGKSPKTKAARASIGQRILRSVNSESIQTKVLQRAQSVRTAIGSLRQKIKTSTKQRKRLTNATPSPFGRTVRSSTPCSAQRRSERLTARREVKMYSPFAFGSPATTPLQPRMGLHEPKRYNFSSPGSFNNDLAYIADEMHCLTNLSNEWSSPSTKTPRTSIRTTPRTNRTSTRKKPLFV